MISLRRALNARYGRHANLTVAGVLEALAKEGFRVVHDIPTAYGNLDHLVAGPTGVFAIEAKSVRGVLYRKGGKLMVNGNSGEPFVTEAAKEALEVTHRLQMAGMHRFVPAVVVSTNAKVRWAPLTFGTVTVVEVGDLAGLLRKQREPGLSDGDAKHALSAVLRANEPVTHRLVGEE